MLATAPFWPSLFLIMMIVLTIILLPYLNRERRAEEERGRTHELHLREKERR